MSEAGRSRPEQKQGKFLRPFDKLRAGGRQDKKACPEQAKRVEGIVIFIEFLVFAPVEGA